MIEVELSQSVRLISPRITVLINTIDEKGELNSSPYSWVFPLGYNPPLVGVCIGRKNKLSYINSKKTGEFVICLVSSNFGQRAINCEQRHEAGDKLWEKNGLSIEKSKKVDTPRIKESKAVLECEVFRFLEYGGPHLLVGKVVHAEAESGGLDQINPLLHDTGGRFRTIGEEIILQRKK
jgi:flavin reductase (DIM6/NTAB) family NADH-FMN oxidoreductase RutF